MEYAVLGASLTAAVTGLLTYGLSFMEDFNLPSPIPYQEFIRQSRTGDILLTASTEITSVTRLITRSMYSHCGILYKDDVGGLYEWSSHAAGEGVMNTSGKAFGGAQLVPLSYLASDNGTVFWKRVHLSARQRSKVQEVIRLMAYKTEFSQSPEFLAFLGGLFAKVFNGFGTGMVCSHTVAITYMAAEAISKDRNLTQYYPETFSDEGSVDWLVPTSKTRMILGCDTTKLINLGS